MVIWIVGKSGSGKTFFSKKIFKILHKQKKCFLVDGDEVRKYLNYDLKHNLLDRKRNSKRIQDLCLYLEKKNYIVICSILSIFNSHQKQNRKIFFKYKQIYLKVDQSIFNKRKSKLSRLKKNIVGKDLKFPNPYKSDLIINNDFKNSKSKVKKMIKLFK